MVLYSRLLSICHLLVPFVFDSLYFLKEGKNRVPVLLRKTLIYFPFLMFFLIDLIYPELTYDAPLKTKYGWVFANNHSLLLLIYNIVYYIAIAAITLFLIYIYYYTVNKQKRKFVKLFLIAYWVPVSAYMILIYSVNYAGEFTIPSLAFSGAFAIIIIFFYIRKYSIFDISVEVATKDILSNISNLVFLINREGTIIDSNRAALETIETDLNKLSGRNFSDISDKGNSLQDIVNITNECRGLETFLYTNNSIKVPVLLSGTEVNKNNQFVGYIIVASDLSGVQKVSDEKRIYELEINSLQAQMNPHFISNSLNSVSYLLNKNEDEKANLYISRLASLFRMILEQTGGHLITIEEEIAILENYLQIESLRFDHNFSYSIDVDGSNDIYLYEIPPMVIQPFVENALWHGLLPLKTKKKLIISFKEHQNSLKISVIDNGVGINGYSFLNPKPGNSRGIANVHERLNLYNKYSRTGKSKLNIINNREIHPEKQGTTIQIDFNFNPA
jgi:PAS domain-containing protein